MLPVLSCRFQREMRNDRPAFHVKDFVLPYCPESTRVVAMNAHDAIDGPVVNLQRPRNKPDPVKPVHALGIGCDPKEAIRGLHN